MVYDEDKRSGQLPRDSKMVSIRMKEERLARVDAEAKAIGLARAEYIRACLDAVSSENVSEMTEGVQALMNQLGAVFDLLNQLETALAVHSAISLRAVKAFEEVTEEDALREFKEESDRFRELAELTVPALTEAVGALRAARLALERW